MICREIRIKPPLIALFYTNLLIVIIGNKLYYLLINLHPQATRGGGGNKANNQFLWFCRVMHVPLCSDIYFLILNRKTPSTICREKPIIQIREIHCDNMQIMCNTQDLFFLYTLLDCSHWMQGYEYNNMQSESLIWKFIFSFAAIGKVESWNK